MNIITRVLFAATLVALPISLVTAQEKGAKPAAQEPKKPTDFSVVQVGEAMKAMASDQVDKEKKHSQEEFTKAMDSWKAAKKAAEDKKEKFEKAEPKAAVFNVVKGGFKTMDEASTFITNAEKEKEKAKKEKEGHEKPKSGK